MSAPRLDPRAWSPFRIAVGAASGVVVLAGLAVAGDILLPILFAVFFAILASPGVRALERLGIPSAVAIVLVVLAMGAALAGLSAALAQTVRAFTAALPRYEEPFQHMLHGLLLQLSYLGVEMSQEDLVALLEPAAVMGFVGATVNAAVTVASRALVVVLLTAFILLESRELIEKYHVAFGVRAHLGPFGNASLDVQRYLFIKTVISLITGVLAGLLCRVLGVEFALMWGIVAFLLNYIPAIGSIVAAIPPILLAVLQFGVPTAAAVTVGYLAINVTLGNIIEPRLLGRSLGLSPLVVFLSLLFWGWLWGPAGMLVCVPMTVIVKLLLENSEETRWIAVFLGSGREARQAEAAGDAGTSSQSPS